MWYVIQTFSGDEEKTADMIRNMVSPDSFEECFVPKRERLKKYHGSWNKVEEILFHGYVFVISKTPKEIYEELKKIPKLTKILGREGDWFLALEKKEEQLIKGIGGAEHRVGVSKVAVQEGKRIHVIEGPLKDCVGNVVKTDLHRREVKVRMKFMGREMELKMGIEMVGINR